MNLYQIQYFKLKSLILCLVIATLVSCNKEQAKPEEHVKEEEKEEVTETSKYGYTMDILSPKENSTFMLGDTLPLTIDYSSTTGEIVHYIRVDIYSKDNPDVSLLEIESHQHVPKIFKYRDFLVLKDSSTIARSADWILKASMWDHEIDTDTIAITSTFRIGTE